MFLGESLLSVHGRQLESAQSPSSFTKLKRQHDIAKRQELNLKTIPSRLRLSSWDVFVSSLNPPTRWSSSLHSEGNKTNIT